MAALFLFSPSPSPSPATVSPESRISAVIFRPNFTLRSQTPHLKTLRIHSSKSSNGQPKKNESNSSSKFLDEDSVVEDMDGYLYHLSLHTKPYWCQPWTITLTGASVIAGCWLILHNVFATSAASALIGTWWYIFLYSYPKYKERKNVEDLKKPQ